MVTLKHAFAIRLREARKRSGFKTAKSLAQALQIDENRYTRYERAEVEPSLTVLVAIADTLKVPIDYLLDRSDEVEMDEDVERAVARRNRSTGDDDSARLSSSRDASQSSIVQMHFPDVRGSADHKPPTDKPTSAYVQVLPRVGERLQYDGRIYRVADVVHTTVAPVSNDAPSPITPSILLELE